MDYYQVLLDECSYLQIDKERLKRMNKTLAIMKSKLQQLKKLQ